MAPSAFDDEVRVGVGETVLAIPYSPITTSVEGQCIPGRMGRCAEL